MSEPNTLTHELRMIAGDDGDWVAGPISASVLREAADAIESLQGRLQELSSEVKHWRVEQVHAYGNWEDAYNRVKELEAYNNTRWHEMFGTPEKAARTYFYQGGDDLLRCGKCPAWRGCKEGTMPRGSCIWETEDAMLKWLKGDGE